MNKSVAQLEAEALAQKLANETGEVHVTLSRSCDRWMVRANSDKRSALAYASEYQRFRPQEVSV